MSAPASAPAAPPDARLVTCSYSGDFEVCGLMCETVDRFVPASIGHTLYVPARDRALFAPLANARRAIETQEGLLPRWLWKLPLPGPAWRARLRLPRRNVYLSPFGPPVRGWIAQQIMKIALAAASPSEIVVHVDSDNLFVRPLRTTDLRHGGAVRLYRNPARVELDSHRLWHGAASRLLGLPPDNFHGAEYIDQIVVWRRSVAQAMTERIQRVSGREWRAALAGTPHFAEYILYGVFADRVLGLEAAGLFATSRSLCHSRWQDEFGDANDEAAFVEALAPDAVACLIQSTIAMTLEARRALLDRLVARARRQDAAPPPALRVQNL